MHIHRPLMHCPIRITHATVVATVRTAPMGHRWWRMDVVSSIHCIDWRNSKTNSTNYSRWERVNIDVGGEEAWIGTKTTLAWNDEWTKRPVKVKKSIPNGYISLCLSMKWCRRHFSQSILRHWLCQKNEFSSDKLIEYIDYPLPMAHTINISLTDKNR